LVRWENERLEFEQHQANFSVAVRKIYETEETFHDGKWMWFDLHSDELLDDIVRLIQIKRKKFPSAPISIEVTSLYSEQHKT